MKGKIFFKKSLCVLIALTLVLLSIPIAASALPSREAKIGVVSDLHYFAKDSMGPDMNEFIKVCKMDNCTTFLAQSVLECALATYKEQAEKGELEFLIIPGDLTKNGEKAGHMELAKRLEHFEEETGVQVFVIDGNHDLNNLRAAKFNGYQWVDDTSCTPAEFEEIYKNLGYSDAIARYKPHGENSEGSLSYVADLGDDYRLIALDGSRYSADNTKNGTDVQETAGSFSPSLLKWAKEQTEKAVKDGRIPIGMTHFNLVPHFKAEEDLFQDFVVKQWEKCADTLADAGMHYIFTGHVHMNDVVSYVSDNGETITDITTASLLSFPNEHRSCFFSADVSGNIDLTYKMHNVDDTIPVVINGEEQAKPFRRKSFGINYGEGGIKSYVMNKLEYELRYGFAKDIKENGGLYLYLDSKINLSKKLGEIIKSGPLKNVSKKALENLLFDICTQIDKKYLRNPEYTLKTIEPMLDDLLNTVVSDVPCTKFSESLGFKSSGDKGTVGDLASTVLAYNYTNNENHYDDAFLQNALSRFDKGQNAETIVNKLLTVILDDLLQNTILRDIKINPVGIIIDSSSLQIVQMIKDMFLKGDEGSIPLENILSLVLMSGSLGGRKLSQVVYSALDEYLTQSQYDIIDSEFYRIIKGFTHDNNPDEMMDLNGTVSYKGKVTPEATAYNLRKPSNIAVTLGDDSATSRNITYYTKYSITNTDVQIVPYSENPDFSKGSRVKAKIETECCKEVPRPTSAIDFGFIGIISHDNFVNRHNVKITGLEKGKKYCYRVGDAEKGWWSPVGVIETADNSQKLSFFHMTDPQSVTAKQYSENWAMAVDTAVKNHRDADFIINTGDLVDSGKEFKQWQRMFNEAADNLVSIPMMSVAGNHEAKGENANVNSFIYPNMPKQDTTQGVYYSFDYNSAHFAILNTNDLNEDGTLTDEQLDWLTEDFKSTKMPWKFVALHKAPYSNGAHFDDKDVIALRDQLSVLMPQLGVDVVFQGHDHVYMRTDAMNKNQVVKSGTSLIKYKGLDYKSKLKPEGTVYTINGTVGVKHYEPKPQSETDKLFPTAEKIMSIQIPSYSHIQIDGGNLYFDSYSVENGKETRIDSFSISKVVTLPDGTVVDGTQNGTIINSGNSDNNGSQGQEDNGSIPNLASGSLNFFASAVAGTIGVTVTFAMCCYAVIKKRREEY